MPRKSNKPPRIKRAQNDSLSVQLQSVGGELDKLKFIDLFCGCGGFTLGMLRAGLHCLGAIDFNKDAIGTLKANLPSLKNVLYEDLTAYPPAEFSKLIGTETVDVVVGGPPCQGFSTARQVDGANHGSRFKEDPRRNLYRCFLEYVDYFQPRVFVMENVLGLRTADGGAYFTAVQSEARVLGRNFGKPGYRVHGQIEDAWELGIPQKRRRQLIIGVRNDLPGYFLPRLKGNASVTPHIVLGAAIGDLPILRAGSGKDERPYDLKRRARHLKRYGDVAKRYLFDVLEINHSLAITNHVSRPHSDRDLRDFARLMEGETSCAAMRRGVKFEFPYDKTKFKDRYTRQGRNGACSTIVAHLSKDGLMFIHPTQNRSLTPREAARIQSFPDWFRFPEPRTHSFRLIGNAVPPLIARTVGLAIVEFLRGHSRPVVTSDLSNHVIESGRFFSTTLDEMSAIRLLKEVSKLDRRSLRLVSNDKFLTAWNALLDQFPGLHPENATDHGASVESVHDERIDKLDPDRTFAKRYQRSGWPMLLVEFGREAWRRLAEGQISAEDFYCVARRVGVEVFTAQ